MNQVSDKWVIRAPIGIVSIRFEKDGNKYLELVKINDKGVESRERYIVQCLLDENWKSTEQTLEQEKKLFPKLPTSERE